LRQNKKKFELQNSYPSKPAILTWQLPLHHSQNATIWRKHFKVVTDSISYTRLNFLFAYLSDDTIANTNGFGIPIAYGTEVTTVYKVGLLPIP